MDKKEMYRKAWNAWGAPAQLLLLVEECAELQHAVLHFLRFGDSDSYHFSLAEEMADVEIMLEQVKHGVSVIGALVRKEKKKKLERLKERLENAKPSAEGREEE